VSHFSLSHRCLNPPDTRCSNAAPAHLQNARRHSAAVQGATLTYCRSNPLFHFPLSFLSVSQAFPSSQRPPALGRLLPVFHRPFRAARTIALSLVPHSTRDHGAVGPHCSEPCRLSLTKKLIQNPYHSVALLTAASLWFPWRLLSWPPAAVPMSVCSHALDPSLRCLWAEVGGANSPPEAQPCERTKNHLGLRRKIKKLFRRKAARGETQSGRPEYPSHSSGKSLPTHWNPSRALPSPRQNQSSSRRVLPISLISRLGIQILRAPNHAPRAPTGQRKRPSRTWRNMNPLSIPRARHSHLLATPERPRALLLPQPKPAAAAPRPSSR